jgi:hypothetical protein
MFIELKVYTKERIRNSEMIGMKMRKRCRRSFMWPFAAADQLIEPASISIPSNIDAV